MSPSKFWIGTPLTFKLKKWRNGITSAFQYLASPRRVKNGLKWFTAGEGLYFSSRRTQPRSRGGGVNPVSISHFFAVHPPQCWIWMDGAAWWRIAYVAVRSIA